MPSARATQLISYLSGLWEEGAQARDDSVLRRADEHIRFARGQQWPANLPRGFIDFVLNLVDDTIQRKAALITDSRPELQVVTTNEQVRQRPDVLDTLKDVTHAIWDQATWGEELARGIVAAEVKGCEVGMVTWDPTAEGGRGEIRPKFFDARAFVMDPAVIAAVDLQQGEFCATEEVRTKASLIEQFGEKAWYCQPDGDLSSYPESRNRDRGLQSPVYGEQFRRRQTRRIRSMIPRVKNRNYWFKDWERDTEGRPLFYKHGKAASRHIRHVVIAGGEVLEDEWNPYWHGDYPYEIFDWGIELENPWGQSEVQKLRRAQETLNKLASQMIKNTLLMNNFKVVGDFNALDPAQWDSLSNKPAMILRRRPGTQLEFESPPSLPPYLFQLLQFLVHAMEMISGLGEVSRGTSDPGQSGIAMESMAIACCDPETECLTQRGWMHYWDVQNEDLLYSMNPETGQGEWTPLLKMNVYEHYSGDMVEIKGQCIDALVTPNHGWYVDQAHAPGKYVRKETTELGMHHRIPLGAPLDKSADRHVYSDAFVQLASWVFTEGCYSTHRSTRNGHTHTSQQVSIRQSYKAHPVLCEAISLCLTQCGIAFFTQNDVKNSMLTWWIGLPDSRNFIAQFPDKRPGYPFLLNLSQHQRMLMIHTMMQGDGRSYGLDRPDGHANAIYHSSDHALLEQFQMLCVLAGFGTTQAINYAAERWHKGVHRSERYEEVRYLNCTQYKTVTMKKRIGDYRQEDSYGDKRVTVPYKGTVWCPTTATGTWLARRNGRTYITSNSQTLIRFQARRLEAFITRLWSKVIPMIFQYYTSARVMRVVGAGEKLHTFLFDRAALFAGLVKPDDVFKDFVLHITPGSSLAVAKIQKSVLMMNLFRAQLIPGVDVLRAAEIKDPEETYKKAQAEHALNAPAASGQGANPGALGRALGGGRRQLQSYPAGGVG